MTTHMQKRRHALANEATQETPQGQVPLAGLGNEIGLSGMDGWAMVAPYGEHPHGGHGPESPAGVQIFGKPEAQALVNDHQSLWARLKRPRFSIGLPVFRGHPDLAAVANDYPDKTKHGLTGRLEARDDGLWAELSLEPSGAKLVQEGLKFLSPHWLANATQGADGRIEYRPARLVSLGLTDRPNIQGKSLSNEKPNPHMNPKLIALLRALGVTVPDGATDDQLQRLLDEATPLANSLRARPETSALTNEQTARTSAETRATSAEARATGAEAEVAKLKPALANARKAIIDQAIKDGRIVEADRGTWERRLESSWDAESAALANTKPSTAIKTAATTSGIGDRRAAPATSSNVTRIASLVNARRKTTGESHDAAFAAVKDDPANAALFKDDAGAA